MSLQRASKQLLHQTGQEYMSRAWLSCFGFSLRRMPVAGTMLHSRIRKLATTRPLCREGVFLQGFGVYHSI